MPDAQEVQLNYVGRNMKNSQDRESSIYDEYEDLTLFAEESFDTGDVDLFEFSSEDDSPLTRLKSIVLSLDWEINDDILQELIDETQSLVEMWRGDKVAEIYLQGLEKIGRYVQNRGAYAHPNAIKLLLTFYYDFEKISVTEEMPEEEISVLLKGDVRKFRILQYQINQEEKEVPEEEPDREIALPAEEEVALADAAPEERDHMRNLKASILGLDWEVTDEGLHQFDQEINHFHNRLSDDKLALVLVQGLRALGDYIQETKAGAHPESFTLLHSFSEGLEQVLSTDPEQRDMEEMQSLLVDRIGRLNTLKAMIADRIAEQPREEYLEDVVDEITTTEPAEEESPVAEVPETEEAESVELGTDIESELDELFPMSIAPGMETADSRYPDEVLPPDAIQPLDDEIADDFIEAQIGERAGLAPALSEADDTSGFDENAEPLDVPAQSDLTAQLDQLFGDAMEEDIAEEEQVEEAAEPEPALNEIEEFEPALAEFQAPAAMDEPEPSPPAEDETALDIESKLDMFFTEKPSDEESIEADAVKEPEDTFTPALADSDEDKGFDLDESVDELEESPLGDIEEKLDFFFDGTSDEEPLLPEGEAIAAPDEPGDFDIFAEEEAALDEPEPVAVPVEDEESDFSEALTFEQEKEPQDLDRELDFFFDAVEDDEDEVLLELDEALPPLADEQEITSSESDLADFIQAAEEESFPEFALPEMEEQLDIDTTPAALAAAVDESLAEGPGDREETAEIPDQTEERDVHIAALGALLPGVVRTPTESGIAETAKLINGLQSLELPGEDKVVVQFLQGILNQLVHSRFIDEAATRQLVNTLYEKLAGGAVSAADLPALTEKYMEWQQGVVSKVITSGTGSLPIAQQEEADKGAEIAAEMDAQQIRRIIREEFVQLRDELQQDS